MSMLWEKETDLERKTKAPVMFVIPGEEVTRALGRRSNIPPATKSCYALRLAGYYRLQRQKRLYEHTKDLANHMGMTYLTLVQARLFRPEAVDESKIQETGARYEALMYLAHRYALPNLPPPVDTLVDKALDEFEQNKALFDAVFYVRPA